MKRAISIVAVLFLSGTLLAQIHGVPPSVTSITRGGQVGGPPASVTSVGPRGWHSPCNATGCISNFFTPTINYQNHSVEFGRQFNLGGKPDHDRRGHFRGGYYGGYVYSYGVPYPVYVIPEDVYQQQQAQEQQPEAPAPTVFENRPTVRPAPNPTPTQAESQPQPSEPPAKNENHVAEEQIPIVLVFKDGHQMEISNYAIVGNTLYELGPYTSHKISLSDLNLKETIQKNDERGIEFSLPSSYKSAG